MKTVDWIGLYKGAGWRSAPLAPIAYEHPARVPFRVAERIYRHMLDEGWLHSGDQVLDPFAGAGGFAFHALQLSLHWTGVELESAATGGRNFVEMAQANIDLWNARYAGKLPGWGSARILQGDSRRLGEIIAAADAVCTSPPYGDQAAHSGSDTPARLGVAQDGSPRGGQTRYQYGVSAGQIGEMRISAGELDGVIASPPYGGNDDRDFTKEQRDPVTRDLGFRDVYSRTNGQIAQLRTGDVDSVVTSPPYLPETDRRVPHGNKVAEVAAGDGGGFRSFYSGDPANLGNPVGVNIETFWGAARVILEQTYAVLRPGAVAAFMTGDFVRDKKRVPFTEQWLALCVAVGFEPLLWAKVWKTEDHGTQPDLFGGEKRLTKDRVGMFRRKNNERNPAAAIWNEDVLFLRRP